MSTPSLDNYHHMVKRWQRYVRMFSNAFRQGKEMSAGHANLSNTLLQKAVQEALLAPAIESIPRETKNMAIVLCSPHPDDECLTGALPLRLLHQGNAQVVNLAVTLGSNPSRKEARAQELENACGLLGFENRIVGGDLGLDGVSSHVKTNNPALWQRNVEALAQHFYENDPDLLFLPHAKDGHPTHQGTHYLVFDALALFSRETKKEVLVIENEFWHPMTAPNLLVAIDEDDLALLVAALTMHVGEIERNPYHLWLPARMMDTVRRGWELLVGCQEKSPDFCFAELYRVSHYLEGEKKDWRGGQKVFTPRMKIDFS